MKLLYRNNSFSICYIVTLIIIDQRFFFNTTIIM